MDVNCSFIRLFRQQKVPLAISAVETGTTSRDYNGPILTLDATHGSKYLSLNHDEQQITTMEVVCLVFQSQTCVIVQQCFSVVQENRRKSITGAAIYMYSRPITSDSWRYFCSIILSFIASATKPT